MDDAVLRIAGAWQLILPEIVLVATACVHFLVAPFLIDDEGDLPAGIAHRWGGLALVGFLTAGGLWWQMRPDGGPVPAGPLRLDDLAWYIRGLSLAAGILLLLTNWSRINGKQVAEHHACLLLIAAGVSLVGAANDLVMLFLALELVSIPTYVLLYLGRNDATGQEAVIKYFLLSVVSSALVLFGMSMLYQVAGTTNLTALQASVAEGAPSMLLVAAALVIAGLAARITTVPFHFYAPDVFQGTATGGAAMLSFVPKAAGFVALLRLLSLPAAGEVATLRDGAEPILWAMAIASMTVGNVLALLQCDIRRMMAWSSVAHAGYMTVGLAAATGGNGGVDGIAALLFYLAVYGAMTLGVFAILAAVRRKRPRLNDDLSLETNDDLAGLSQTHPAAALLMTVFLFSLTGLPPTAGFLGKLNLLLAAWSADAPIARWTAVLMALNAGIAAWYYLRLIGIMYLQPADESEEVERRIEPSAFIGAAVCGLATIALFTTPDWLWQTVSRIGG